MALRTAAAVQGFDTHSWPHCVRNAMLSSLAVSAVRKTLEQIGILLPQDSIQGWPVESSHTQVTQDDVIAVLVELRQGVRPVVCRVDGVAAKVRASS
jgi:hypothetical protein